MSQSQQTNSTKNSELPSVPLLDISRQNGPLKSEIQLAITQVCQSGRFVFGPDCQELEQRVAALCNAQFGIGCASGSDALLLALMALDIGPGDEVIIPSFTFFATASAVTRLGATPVFVDIDPKTFNMNVDLIPDLVTDRTRAIIPVHLFGQPAEMDSLMSLATTHGLFVVEDAAQSLGARYQGQPIGGIGHVSCTSFYPTKNLGGFGDGGMLMTSDPEIADRLRKLRNHGMHPRYVHDEVGANSRLDSIQAAVLNVKIAHLARWQDERGQNAKRYRRLFESFAIADIELPSAREDCLHVWNQFTVRVGNGKRDALRDYLTSVGVGSEVYYPIPLHRQECFRHVPDVSRPLPETDKAAAEVLSLPVFPELTQSEQQTVVSRIADFQAQRISDLGIHRQAG